MEPEKYLEEQLRSNILPTYVYGYPSKRTYREITPKIGISEIKSEVSSNKEINIYIHIPFCKYRCSYCTLFLTTKQTEVQIEEYVDRLVEHILGYGQYLGDKQVCSVYFGGGTPTLLTAEQFAKIFNALDNAFPLRAENCEINVECAPDCIYDEQLDALKAMGVNRISMGIQSLQENEMVYSGRPYKVDTAYRAIDALMSRFEHVSLDLIYGLREQTKESWLDSLNKILNYKPATISLYPVVSRPLTNIEKMNKNRPEQFFTDEEKYHIYDLNVEILKENGYTQESFTRFTRMDKGDGYYQETSDFKGTPLLGLGTGARSYFGKYHYSSHYAVNRSTTMSIIDQFIETPFDDKSIIEHGIVLDTSELKRRYTLLNLSLSHLNTSEYKSLFGENIEDAFPNEIKALSNHDLITLDECNVYRLTPKGYKFSSLLVRLFYSDDMIKLEQEYQSI